MYSMLLRFSKLTKTGTLSDLKDRKMDYPTLLTRLMYVKNPQSILNDLTFLYHYMQNRLAEEFLEFLKLVKNIYGKKRTFASVIGGI
jgi:hypothetical protein